MQWVGLNPDRLGCEMIFHLNPILAGYGATLKEREFTGYPEYLGLREGSLPVPDVVLAQFPTREAYQGFAED